MPTLADADGCCSTCDGGGGCSFAFTCPCHRDRSTLQTSLRDLNAAAREVPFDRFTTPEWDQ